MENDIVRFLYRYMQEIKIKINDLKGQKEYYEKLIISATEDEQELGTNYNNFLKQYRSLKFKFCIFSIITFGLYYKREKYDYELRIELLNAAIDDYDWKYDNIVNCLAIYEQEKDNCEVQKEKYKMYLNQIDMFNECVKSMTDFEKEKLLNMRKGDILL